MRIDTWKKNVQTEIDIAGTPGSLTKACRTRREGWGGVGIELLWSQIKGSIWMNV